ncbi:poly-beta-1,6-N-acetyl-D-glucosamine synthase [Phascolarctobacterium sp.]
MMEEFVYYIGVFIFYYPLVMSMFWMIGGLLFYFRREYGVNKKQPPALKTTPLVTVLIPARNESSDIEETITSIYATKYPSLEIIVINDASTDMTLEILNQIASKRNNLRILDLKENLGKANALNLAFAMSNGDIILTIDADCLLGKEAISWMVWHFNTFPRVGAVTGNPRVRNRTSLLAQIQVAEYSSVVGLIKRTHRIIGKIMTVSGVIVAWRKSALVNGGLWSNDMITDDIDMTWKLEQKFWDVRYEPNAICWMLVPETMKGLWKQRKRWAQGGVEVIRKYKNVFLSYKQRRIWLIYFDYCLGILWAHVFVLGIFCYCFMVLGWRNDYYAMVGNPFFNWNGSVIAVMCLMQFLLSCILDYKYDNELWKIYFWCVWYPVVYWFFNSLAVVCVTWKALFKSMKKHAVWESPDRGIR